MELLWWLWTCAAWWQLCLQSPHQGHFPDRAAVFWTVTPLLLLPAPPDLSTEQVVTWRHEGDSVPQEFTFAGRDRVRYLVGERETEERIKNESKVEEGRGQRGPGQEEVLSKQKSRGTRSWERRKQSCLRKLVGSRKRMHRSRVYPDTCTTMSLTICLMLDHLHFSVWQGILW